MSKLFNWAAARLVSAFALALCFATPLVSWADAITAVNPVTGETETYTYKFVGTDSVWNNTANWQDSNGSNPSAVPAKSASNTWAPILFDQAENQSIAIGAALSVEGWNLRMGLYNGASVTLNNLQKLQGGLGMWITVDSSSHCTIAHMENKKLANANPLCLYSANEGGIAWSEELSSSGNESGDTAMPFHYYLAGNGTVAYNGGIAAAAGGAHVIKQADVTLSGNSKVVSKTLVSFTSSSTTFTADAAIKVKNGDNVLKTVYLTSVTAGATTLTAESDVGTCELVQTSTGIDLYYVDGDPADVNVEEKTYKPSISINFTNGAGNGLTTQADVGLSGYAVPGTSWNNYVVANSTFSTVNAVDSTGAASAMSGVSVTISGTRGSYSCGNLTPSSNPLHGYIDENGNNPTPTVTVTGIPYYKYRVLVYHSTDSGSVPFGYDTINGTNYTYVNDALSEGTTAWGNSGAQDSANAIAEGSAEAGNVLVTEALSGSTLTVVGHRAGGNSSARGCIAAIQIIEVKADVGENDLEIPVSGDTQYTVEETKELSGTVYLTGLGTLTLAGENKISAATIEISEGVTLVVNADRLDATTFTGAGTVVYDGSQPDTTKGFDNSAWTGTVWVKNVGDTSKGEATDAKVTTRLGSDTTDATSNELNKWGNANSFVKFTNVRAFMAKADVLWTLVLEDDDTNYAWYNNQGWTARSITIAGLKGDGTFWDINDGGCRPYLNFGDASQFMGTIKALGKQVFLNDTTNTGDASSGLAGRITVPANQTLTVASGKTWHTRNGLVVNGTLNVNGTLASDSTTAAVSGSGTVVFTGSAPSPTGDAWWKNASWTGTVQMKSVTLVGTDLAFNDYGNTGSILELNGCSGWLTPAYTCTVPLKITGTLTLNNGYSGKGNAFKVGTLLGDGTISGSDLAPTMVFNVTDGCSNFTGKVQLTNKCVVFGSSIPDSLTEGRIYIAEGAQVTVQNTAEAGWWAVGGIQVDGELRANSLARFGGGTNITTSDNGVFTLTSTGNGSEGETDTDYARIKGTGSLKYEGTGWRALTTNNLSTAVTLVNEQSGDILLSRALTYTIGSLSGSKKFQGNYGSGSRYLNIVQTKDTEWSGTITTDNSSRLAGFSLDATSTGTLTLSGTETQSATLAVNGGSVNLTGTWVGATTVSGTFGGTGTLTGDLTFSDGATFKAFAADDEDGLVVSGTVGYPAEGTVTVDVSAIEPETDVALIKATDLNSDKFVLATGAPEGYALEVVDGVLTLTVPHVTITVPSIANTTVTVKIGDNTIGTSSGDYNVAPDSVVTVTYAAVDGYEISGTTEYTIDTSKSETTFDPAGTTEVKQYVASITAGETTTKYTTLQAAIDAVAQNKDIVLLANEADGATVSREITFNVVPGEYTYGDIAAGGDYILTTTALEGKTRYSLAPAVIAVTIDDVRTLYSMINATSGIEAANAGSIGTTIEILSGDPQDYVDYLPMFDLNTDTGVFTKVADPVAAVYEGVIQQQVYRTLADAVAAATSGQTVKLLADVTLDSTVAVTNSLTLDLNGFGIAATDARALWIKAGTVSITGEGEISANATENSSFVDTSSVIRVGDSAVNANAASLAIGADVTVSSGHCYGITTFGKNTPGISLVVNGTVAVTGTESAISGNGSSGLASANITVNDGAVVSATADAGIYFPGTGTLSIAGGTITGPTAVYAKCGTINITGGTLTGTAEKSAYAYNGNGLNATGDALVIDTCGYPGNPATVSVTGGTFTSQNAEAVASYKKGDDAKYADDTVNEAAAGFVSGGTFNTAVADTYCAEGFEPTDDGNGTYGVRVDKGWIYEDADFPGYTGSWNKEISYDETTHKAAIEDGATYTASKPSAGQLVTINLELSFDAANSDGDVHEGAKAAVRLGEGDTEGTYVFQLYTTNETGTAAWLNAAASGVTPTIDQDYEFTFVLDMTNKTFTATVDGVALTVAGAETLGFASANASDTVQSIEFAGAGKVSSIIGSYEDIPVPDGFVADEKIGDVTLTAAQAEWLNGQGNYDALAEKIETMSQTALDNAYLLNLNIAGDFSYEFGVSDFKVDTAAGTATVYVTLTRTGALAENEVAKPIIGTLKLTGTAEIGTAFVEIGSADLTFDANAGFGGGATTTAVTVDIGENGTGAKFYLPVIE